MNLFRKLIEMIKNLITAPKDLVDLRSELKLVREAHKELEFDLEIRRQETIQANEYANEYRNKYEELSKNHSKIIKNTISNLIENSLNTENAQDIYNRLKPLDSEGWAVYKAAKEILNIDVFQEFIVEDSMGRFEESDGYELLHYAEIAGFGNCSYKIVGNMYEVLDSYNIDTSSKEYIDYLNKLFPLAIKNIVDRINYVKDVDYLSVIEKFVKEPSENLYLMDSGIGTECINPSNNESEDEIEL